jgi:TolB-like protein/DNA-binding winged helix-turn-helix (wHTH) protein/tetratricopeptide (TPR) repeat protein
MTSEKIRGYEFGPFRLMPAEKRLLRDGDPVQLTPKAFDLLVVLVQRAGHLVEKSELMNRVWPDSFVEEANLSVKMSELRRALGESSNENIYIETVPRRGYRFVAGVREFEDAGKVAESTTTSGNEGGLRTKGVWLAGVAALLIAAALLVGFNVGGSRNTLFGKPEPLPIRALAVLPLENLSGDPSQDYFADGMTEALITDLAKISDLRVMSRAAVMKYKGTRPVPAEIGRDLNVEGMITGSVIRAGDRVRIAVQLIDAPTGGNLWASTYERELRDVLSLQDEITRDVVGRIRTGLNQPAPARSESRASVNPEAFDHYLRGRFYLNRQNREDNESAIAALEKSVAADPAFAAAHAELAQAYVWKLFLFDPKDERRLAEKAFLSSEKALALDPDLAVAYLARGRLLWTPANHFPHEKAIKEYRRALSLDPNLDEARNQLALVYYHIGALDEAMRESQMAIATNPANNLAQLRIGQTLSAQGKHAEALAVFNGLPAEVNPALIGHQTVWALVNLGRLDEAGAMLERLIEKFPEDTGGVYTSIQAVLAASRGDDRLANQKIGEAIERGKGFGHFHHTAYHIACAYARLNRKAEAIKWLESAATDGFPCYPMFERDTNLDNLRNDEAFVDLLAKLKQQ